MTSHFRSLFAAAAGVLLASSGQADQNLTGNTVVEGRLGVGLPVTSPVTVPSKELHVIGSGLFRSSWTGLYLQEPATTGDDAFGVRYINHTADGSLQFYFDPAFPSGDNRQIIGVGEDLGVVIGRDGGSQGYRLHVRRTTGDSGAVAISAPSGMNPSLVMLGVDMNPRLLMRSDETGGTNAIFFNLPPTPGATSVTTLSLFPSGTAGVSGKVAIGSHVPTERLDVQGNIKASGNISAAGDISTESDIIAAGDISAIGNISAASPTQTNHVVTLNWLKTEARIPARGDILMGEFDEGPDP